MAKSNDLNIKNGSALLITGALSQLEEYAKETAEAFKKADVFYLSPKEKGGKILTEQIGSFIDSAQLAATGESKLMVIIDASQMMHQAQNKLLKTIEESPSRTSFLLLATDLQRILPTIKSRCVITALPPSPFVADEKILALSKRLLECKTFSSSIPLMKEVNKDNIPSIILHLYHILPDSNLPKARIFDMMKKLAEVNRNIMANCNPERAFDLFLMELTK